MAGSPGIGLSPIQGLLYELGAILSALMLGVLAVRLHLIKPERGDMAAMGFVTGNIGLPLLLFRTVATARLGGLDHGVVFACGLGKFVMMAIIWATTYFAYKLKTLSKKERFLTASVFSLVAVITNDFALGFPVVEALYGQEMTAYTATNAVVGSALFTPLGSILLAVGSSLPDDSGNKNGDAAEKAEPLQRQGNARSSTSRTCANSSWLLCVIGGALMNSVIASVTLGLLYKLIFSWTIVDDGHTLRLPFMLEKVLSLFTSPFGMCSLFMTGTKVRSVKISIWPLFPVVSKVVVVAFISFQLSTMMVQRDSRYTEKTNFSFFYGTIPTSATPIILGSRFAPASTELVATSILMAIFLAGIIMCMFAVNAMTPGDASMHQQLAELQKYLSILSVGSMAVVAAGVLVLTLKGGWGWGRPGKQMLAALGASIAVYQSAMLVFDQLVLGSGEALCGGWSAVLVAVAFFQNLSRLLVLGFPVLILRWGPRRLGAVDTFGCTGLVIMALAGSAVLCSLVHPNAVTEVCLAAAAARGRDLRKITAGVRIRPINLVDQLLFWAMLVLLVAIAWQRWGRWRGRRPSEGEAAGAAEAGVEPGVGGADGDTPAEEADALEEWLRTPPRSLFRMLMLAQALRMLQQVINSSQVLTNAKVNGGFVTMLILEYFLEHGQGFLLLVGFAFDTKFMNALAQAITSALRWAPRLCAVTPGGPSPCDLPSTYPVSATCGHATKNQESATTVTCKSEGARSLNHCPMQQPNGLQAASESGDPEINLGPTANGPGSSLHGE